MGLRIRDMIVMALVFWVVQTVMTLALSHFLMMTSAK